MCREGVSRSIQWVHGMQRKEDEVEAPSAVATTPPRSFFPFYILSQRSQTHLAPPQGVGDPVKPLDEHGFPLSVYGGRGERVC